MGFEHHDWNCMSFINCISESSQKKVFWTSLKMWAFISVQNKTLQEAHFQTSFLSWLCELNRIVYRLPDLCDISLAKADNLCIHIWTYLKLLFFNGADVVLKSKFWVNHITFLFWFTQRYFICISELDHNDKVTLGTLKFLSDLVPDSKK